MPDVIGHLGWNVVVCVGLAALLLGGIIIAFLQDCRII